MYTILFFSFLFFLPHTKISIPSLGRFEVTFSDGCVLLLFMTYVFARAKMDTNISKFLYVFLFFFFTMFLTILVATSYWSWLLGMMPYIFGIFLISSLSYYASSVTDKIAFFKSVWYVLVFTLILSAIPVYLQIFTGAKFGLFWDRAGWRYTFLSQNPNQFGVYFILYMFLIVLLCLRFFKRSLKYILLLILFMLPAALFSGSRTAMVATAFVLIILLVVLFIEASTIKKIIVAPITLLVFGVALSFMLQLTEGQGGQIKRALSIFDKVQEQGLGAAKVEGATGVTMIEAVEIYSANPILGIGLNNKKAVYQGIKNEIHNTYLKILADSGTFGFLAFLMIFLFPIVCIMSMKGDFLFKIVALGSFGVFMIMNWPHTLIRQRWVWLFMFLLFLMSRYNRKGEKQSFYVSFLV